MVFNPQRSKFKVEAGYRPPSCFRVSITYKGSHLFSATASPQDRMSLGTGLSGFWAIRQSAHASKFLTAHSVLASVLAGMKPSEKVANWSLVVTLTAPFLAFSRIDLDTIPSIISDMAESFCTESLNQPIWTQVQLLQSRNHGYACVGWSVTKDMHESYNKLVIAWAIRVQ